MGNNLQPKLPLSHLASLLNISVQALHKRLKSQKIAYEKIGNKAFITYPESKKLLNINHKKKTITSHIVKGGTGKTTSIQNIASCANSYGAKVLLIDIDPQGNLTDSFNIDADETPVLIDCVSDNIDIEESIINISDGFDFIPSRIENVVLDGKLSINKYPLNMLFKNLLDNISHQYDYILIDCPPTMGHAVTSATLYADMVLVPLNPNKFSTKGLKILKDEILSLSKIYKRDIKYKVFLNKFSGNTILSDKIVNTIMADEFSSGNALTTAIRRSQEIENINDAGLSLFSSLKKSSVRDDYELLTKELLEFSI